MLTPDQISEIHRLHRVEKWSLTLARVSHLIELAKGDALSPEERTEFEDFLQLEHLIIVAKARARRNGQR